MLTTLGGLGLAVEFATASRVREGLAKARNVELVLKERDGRVWRSASGDVEFRLSHALAFPLRPQFGSGKLTIQEGRLTLGQFCWVNVCLVAWREEILAKPAPFLANLQKADGLVCHISVEQLNFSDARRPAVDGLSEGDLEEISALIKRPVEEFFQRTVAQEQQFVGSRYSQPVLGRLHWNWRAPNPEVAKFHEIGADFTSTFSPERVTELPFEKYVREQNLDAYGGRWFRVRDEPGVRILIPATDRDAPNFFPGCKVEFGSVEVPLPVQLLAHASLQEYGLLVDAARPLLSLYLIQHPFSLLLPPKREPPAGVTPELANRAIDHLRTVWLLLKPSINYADVLTI